MNSPTLKNARAVASPGRLGSLRLRLVLALALLNALVVAGVDGSLDGFDTLAESAVRNAGLVLLLIAGQGLLVELLLMRPLQRLAAGCEAVAAAPLAAAPPALALVVAGEATELDRIGQAVQQARRSGWQQAQDAQQLRHELAAQQQALAQATAALAGTQRELAELSRTDTLTGLANQRAFDEALRREFKRAQRLRGLLALAVLDLDQFKQFNLAHGSVAGDAALQRVGALLRARLKRDTDVVARLGGEEFVALLPGFGMAEAQNVLESLRDDLRGLRLPGGEGELTISIGLAAVSPAHPYLSAQALMQAADEALYVAKHAGRDRLSLAA